MKYSVYVTSNIKKIPPETTEIHVSRPVKISVLKKLLRKCKNLQRITMNKSSFERLSGKARELLEKNQVKTAIGKSKGRPISIDLEKLLHILELRRDYRSYGEISQVTGIPKSTVHYLIKYADRGKIKQGKQVIHLK